MQPTSADVPQLLTAKQAAELLGCHVETVHRLRKSGMLRARLHGTRTYRFRRADVEGLTTAAIAVPVPFDRQALAAVFREFADYLDR